MAMILVVIPAYNEEKTIGRVVRGLFEHGFENVVVVNDGSKDATAQIAKDLGVVVLNHPINRGQGAALETGNTYARQVGAEMVVHFDADLQFNPADIAPAVSSLKEGSADILLGSRFMDNRSRIPWFKKYCMLPLGRLLHRFLVGIHLSDAHNGFRILKRGALDAITITQDGMAHNTEILQQIREKSLRYMEFPVEVTYHEFGQGVTGGVKIMLDLFSATIFK